MPNRYASFIFSYFYGKRYNDDVGRRATTPPTRSELKMHTADTRSWFLLLVWFLYNFLTNISIFDQNLDLCANLLFDQNLDFWPNFLCLVKISIFDQILYFCQNFWLFHQNSRPKFLFFVDQKNLKIAFNRGIFVNSGRGVQIQSFTLHQANLYKLQTRILHHDSFLKEVPNSGTGTPAGFLSPTRVLSPGLLSGDEERVFKIIRLTPYSVLIFCYTLDIFFSRRPKIKILKPAKTANLSIKVATWVWQRIRV